MEATAVPGFPFTEGSAARDRGNACASAAPAYHRAAGAGCKRLLGTVLDVHTVPNLEVSTEDGWRHEFLLKNTAVGLNDAPGR